MSPHISRPLGMTLIGNMLASVLFGVITVQTKSYFSRFPQDSRWVKGMVAFLWLSQGLQVILTLRGVHWQAIRRRADPLLSGPQIWFHCWYITSNSLVGPCSLL
ncbi:hypothetical protein DL93DRAFT_2085352, partial [Clavulina sp. PMI_390]